MSDIFKRNDALTANPTVANIDLSTNGSNWLWAVFCIMSVSALVLAVLAGRQPIGRRVFHNLGAAICFTAAIAYFCMASDLGATAIPVQFIRGGNLGQSWVARGIADPTRSVWYARYIDWTITTPLLLLELLLATGLPLSDIFMVIFADEVMIQTGLIGGLIRSRYKWGLFTFGCVALIYIWTVLLWSARRSAGHLGPDYNKVYIRSAAFLSILWLLYPVAWGLSEGGNVIKVTSEMIFYGILDILAKPVFIFYHLWQVRNLDYAALQLSSGKFSDGATTDSMLRTGDHGFPNGADPRSSMSTAVGTGHHDGSKHTPAAPLTSGRGHNSPLASTDGVAGRDHGVGTGAEYAGQQQHGATAVPHHAVGGGTPVHQQHHVGV